MQAGGYCQIVEAHDDVVLGRFGETDGGFEAFQGSGCFCVKYFSRAEPPGSVADGLVIPVNGSRIRPLPPGRESRPSIL